MLQKFIILVLILVLGLNALYSQKRNITVQVLSETGRPVPGYKVELSNSDHPEIVSERTNREGICRFSGLEDKADGFYIVPGYSSTLDGREWVNENYFELKKDTFVSILVIELTKAGSGAPTSTPKGTGSTKPKPTSSGSSKPTSSGSKPKVDFDKSSKNPKLEYVKVPVFFATDRNLSSNPLPSKRFGTDRSTMSYGICNISIPKNHKMGELEEASVWKLEFSSDPKKHVLLLDVNLNSEASFFDTLRKSILKSPNKNAFIFVHGYNVSFEDAARRTGQMSYDLGFKGAPVFYSWPSQATLAGYNIDQGNIEWSQKNMKVFLEDFLKKSDAEKVYLIAHSMGNRGLTRALASIIFENPELTSRIQAIILAAPDIDADVFRRDIAPVLVKSKKYIALYTSSKDKALIASQKFSSYPRAGQAGQNMVIVPGIETIDASNVKADFLNHSYFSQSSELLSDIFNIIKEGRKSSERFGLVRYKKNGKTYWKFKN